MMFRRCLVGARAQRGFTLTEVAIVLGIIGLILSAIWAAAAAVYNNMRISSVQRQLLTVTQNMRSMYASQSDFGSEQLIKGSGVLEQANIFPAEAVDIGSGTPKVTDPWGGDFYVLAPSQLSGAANSSSMFDVVMENVPKSACITLATNTTGNGRDNGLVHVVYGTGSADEANFPISATAAANSGCQDKATVAWTFRLRN